MDDQGSADHVAVVTGGASGVGRAVCGRLARDGHAIGVLDLDPEAAEQTVRTLTAGGGRAIAVPVDVAARDSVDEAFAAVRRALGPVTILVTSAAVSGFVPFGKITLDDWDRTIAVNLTGTFNCLQAALPDMVAAGWGRIVTISSAAGQTGSVRQGHYSASKGGVIALTKTVALEYAAKGITANTVPPFTVDTPMLRAAQDAQHIAETDTLARFVPARRLGTPDDIANVCAFLCSDDASYITGQVIAPNGGAVT
jgi:NAD(P)-dependent dehydrogenase (short-subunit alcohol dehydrogenase family)